jgi:16S rRNA (cytosine967-C5)-methyltransferase
LDYCGGAAGKSLAIAPFTQGKGQIFVHDIRKTILMEAKKRLRRAGVQNYQLNNDKEDIRRILRNKCDWILLDVPCSGTGTIRRNPDLKYKFSLERLEETLHTQEKIFEESLDLIKPNGKIVYVTCSILKEENINQIMKFCRKFGVKIDNDTIFQTEPKSKRMDGFFSVTLKL